jgi:hypothetical protein
VDAADEIVITIEAEEWDHVARRLASALRDDERDPLSKLAVATADGVRRWYATDSYRLVVVRTAVDPRSYAALVSPRLLEAWPLLADGSEADLHIDRSADPSVVTMSGPGGSLAVEVDQGVIQDVEDLLLVQGMQPGATVTVDVEALAEILRLARRAPEGPFLDDDHDDPLLWIATDGTTLEVELTWPELGTTTYRMAVEGSGTARVTANPRYLAELLASLDPGDAELTLPEDPEHAIRIVQDPVVGLLMPLDPGRVLRQDVETILAAMFGPDVVHPDADGDYLLSADGVPVFAQVLWSDPPQLRLFAVVLDSVEATPDLLGEINQLNTSIGMARVLWADGQVVVAGELVATTLDPEELAALFARVRGIAADLGPALSAVFGGYTVMPGEEYRWSVYAEAILLAELVPGEWVRLNGPGAVEGWPFPGEVHVVTAWNPAARNRPDVVNQEATAHLSADLTRAGAGFLRARRRLLDGDLVEQALVVWGLDRTGVLDVVRPYRQEVVFAVDATTMSVVGVYGDRTSSRPRLDAALPPDDSDPTVDDAGRNGDPG